MAEKKDVLHPYGNLDVLYYYSRVAGALSAFLKGRPVATKIWLGKNILFFLRRASKDSKLEINDLKIADEKFLKLRVNNHLHNVKKQLNEKQILVWRYFVPRKLITLFYSTNDEGIGGSMDRIFIDIDLGKHSKENGRIVADNLVKVIKEDKKLNKLLKYKIIVLWTGASFHVYLFLNKKINVSFYERYFSFGKKKPDSFIARWADEITKKTEILVSAGHIRSKKAIILDSSETPSGKLARAPFSLHMKDSKNYNGICVPVDIKELKNKNLISRLEKLNPESILKNLDSYKKLL